MTTSLHPIIRTFLDAHLADDYQTALRTFSPTAVVTDQGETFRGTDAIDRFLREAGSEYTYTTEERGAEKVDDAHWGVAIHLEGNFPGGVADITYRFTLADDLITELSIG
jgi:hypothetical protein